MPLPQIVIRVNRRFLDDARRLPSPIQKKLDGAVREIREHGVRHSSLRTRKLEGNPDTRFRLMDVDDQYRIVAILEGVVVFLEKVGNHDETIKWGERASLREYEDRLELGPGGIPREKVVSAVAPAASELFEHVLSLPEIVEHEDQVSDLIAGDIAGALEGYCDGTIEDWMVFLSPLQRRAVDRATHGPARVSGGPGTGKTVVALHRAAEIARSLVGHERLLVTSFVNTVPDVLQGLVRGFAADVVDRIDFRGIHSLAGSVLAASHRAVRVDEAAARRRFDEALEKDMERAALLRSAGFSAGYLWDEVTKVVEGREFNTVEAYASAQRHGRHGPMRDKERRVLWTLYEDYRTACDRPESVVDWSRHLALARQAAAGVSANMRYRAIVIDEAQDMTQAGLGLLLALLDDGPRGQILLVGDNGQRIYPGGFRLGDLDVDVRGRSFVLDTCYRSTDEIMRTAGALGRYLSPEDYGADGLRSVGLKTVRFGSKPQLREFQYVSQEQKWVLEQLASVGVDREACAVLVPSNNLADKWRQAIAEAGMTACSLLEYVGEAKAGIKVGTYNRAKGLEFKHVFLPNLSTFGFPVDSNDADQLVLRGSQLYVALTRARDRLSLSFAGDPCLFIDALLDYVDLA